MIETLTELFIKTFGIDMKSIDVKYIVRSIWPSLVGSDPAYEAGEAGHLFV